MTKIYPVAKGNRSKHVQSFCNDCGRLHWYKRADIARDAVYFAHIEQEQISMIPGENSIQLGFI